MATKRLPLVALRMARNALELKGTTEVDWIQRKNALAKVLLAIAELEAAELAALPAEELADGVTR